MAGGAASQVRRVGHVRAVAAGGGDPARAGLVTGADRGLAGGGVSGGRTHAGVCWRRSIGASTSRRGACCGRSSRRICGAGGPCGAVGDAAAGGHGRSHTVDAIMIAARLPEVADPAVPGHWEGDLLAGRHLHVHRDAGRAVVTLLVVLVKVRGKDSATAVRALIRRASIGRRRARWRRSRGIAARSWRSCRPSPSPPTSPSTSVIRRARGKRAATKTRTALPR